MCSFVPGESSLVVLQMWMGPVPIEMQAALSPVVAKMRVWASPVLLQTLAECQVPAQMCDVVIQSRRSCG